MFGIQEISKGMHFPNYLKSKESRQREADWKIAKDKAQLFGVVDALKNRALQLREEGDSTTELWESSSQASPDYVLTLIFNGDMAMADAYFRQHGYKGVRVVTTSSGDSRIQYTQNDKWEDFDPRERPNVEDNLRLDIFSAQRRASEVSGLRNSIDKFKSIDYQK